MKRLWSIFSRPKNKRSELDYFRRAIEAIPGLVTIFDHDMTYLLINSRVEEFVGISRDLIIGKKVGFNEKNPFVDAIREFFKTDEMFAKIRLELQGKSGRRWFIVSMSKIPDTTHVLVVSTDIDEQVLAEKEAASQRQKAEESARLASIGELAAGIAHEINNPLFIITSKSEQLIRDLKRSGHEEFIANVEKIRATGFRISKIVSGMKNLSRSGENDAASEFLVSTVIEDIQVVFESKLKERHIELRTEVAANLSLLANPTQVGQVLLNLVGNAFDELRKRNEPGWIFIKAESIAGYGYEISVSNSGPPIPPDIRAKIMTPFFTTKPAGQGTGLGLAICQRIAKDHQGEFILDPNSNFTRFVLRIPKNKSNKNSTAA